MAWTARATRVSGHFFRHSPVSGVSSTVGAAVVHSSAGLLHRIRDRLWTTGLDQGPQEPAASNAAAISSSRRSAPNGATIWTPTGKPSVL